MRGAGVTLRRVKNIVILISGRGSNMEAIVRAAEAEHWLERGLGRIAAIVSNRPDAAGLAFARQHGIPTAVVDHKLFAGREAFDTALQTVVDAYAPDLLILAGFMRILTTGFVKHYQGRMLNIHPSLLPAFPGLATHRQALAAGVRIHGATVHFVTPDLDHGPIVVQASVPVLPGDTEETLARRVLDEEHRIYPEAIRRFAEGRLRCIDGLVEILPEGVPQSDSGRAP